MSATVDTRQETPGKPPRISSRRLTERVFRVRESGIIVVLIVFVAITVSIEPRFASQQEVQFILANTTIFALLALGETMVIVSRNVDLSIGSVVGLSAYVSASLFGKIHGIPILVVFLVGLGIGLAVGVANGLMVAIGRVPSLVVTLATLYIVRGLDILIVGGNEVVAQTLPNAFIEIPRAGVYGVPYLAIVIAAVIGVGAYYLRSYRSGRELYAIGSVVGLSAYVSASLFGKIHGIPIVVVFLVGLGIGLAVGVANGLMVAIGRVPSLVVTLATLYIVRGLDILIVGGNEVVAQTLPNAFIQIPRAGIYGVPYLAIVIAVVIGVGAYYLRSYRSGRELYAIGSNPEAARLAGIRVGRRVFTAFAVSGAIAGVAGVLWAAQ